jgi:hypothetical protein
VFSKREREREREKVCRDYILEYAAPLMNKPTVSLQDLTLEGEGLKNA